MKWIVIRQKDEFPDVITLWSVRRYFRKFLPDTLKDKKNRSSLFPLGYWSIIFTIVMLVLPQTIAFFFLCRNNHILCTASSRLQRFGMPVISITVPAGSRLGSTPRLKRANKIEWNPVSPVVPRIQYFTYQEMVYCSGSTSHIKYGNSHIEHTHIESSKYVVSHSDHLSLVRYLRV